MAKRPKRPSRPTALEPDLITETKSPTTGITTYGVIVFKSFDYKASQGVDHFVRRVADASPIQIVAMEKRGVKGAFVKDLSKRMALPISRVFTILGLPKATAEKKAAAGEVISGRGGLAILGMTKLLGIAQRIVDNSSASAAKDFDAAKWLGEWIERPQPALGGLRPSDLIDTPTGVEIVARVLGAIESGTYQ